MPISFSFMSRRFCSLLLGLFLVLLGTGAEVRAGESTPQQLIYFDPDSAQGNLGRLKDELNQFLQRHDLDIQAQPVARIDTFEQLINAQHDPIYLVVPLWYLNKNGGALSLTPLLSPLTDGRPEYHKVIVVRQDSLLQPAELKNKTMAMAAINREAARIELDKALFNRHGLDTSSPQLILTSRDYDSLIALLLGRVDAAVVVKGSLDRLATVNPAMIQRLKTIAESTALPMPVLCVRGVSPGTATADIIKVFTHPEQQEKFMRILGFDRWQLYASQARSQTLFRYLDPEKGGWSVAKTSFDGRWSR